MASNQGTTQPWRGRKQRRPGSERVLSAALGLTDESGVTSVTIRAVAQAVGVAPMTLYVHFRSKEQLLDLMAAEAVQRLCEDSAQSTWQAELTCLCHQVRKVPLEHPGWAPLLSRPAAARQLRPRARLVELMVLSGFSEHDALNVVSTSLSMIVALALREVASRGLDSSSSASPNIDLEQGFGLFVGALVRGLEPNSAKFG